MIRQACLQHLVTWSTLLVLSENYILQNPSVAVAVIKDQTISESDHEWPAITTKKSSISCMACIAN